MDEKIVSLQELMPDLKRQGMIAAYTEYKAVVEHNAAVLFYKPAGIHGAAHAERVLFLALLLGTYNNLPEGDKHILAVAAMYHDIGRFNDMRCELHGDLSVKKIITLGLCSDFVGDEQQILYFIIAKHCINDDMAYRDLDAEHIVDKSRAARLFAIFKDSDALDRCRIGGLDTSYLRNPYAIHFVHLAQELFSMGSY